jgi:hypothetical protein
MGYMLVARMLRLQGRNVMMHFSSRTANTLSEASQLSLVARLTVCELTDDQVI